MESETFGEETVRGVLRPPPIWAGDRFTDLS